MNVLVPLLLSTLAGLSTIIGCIFMFIKVKNIDKYITFCLSLSLTIMIYLSIFDLIPASFTHLMLNDFNVYTIPFIILVFLSGIILVNIIDKKMDNKNSLYKLGMLNMISLIIHNFPEGIATFLSSMEDMSLGIKLTVAIMFHNIPEGISIAIPIYYATKDKKKAFFYTLLSGISEPVGAILAYIFLKNIVTMSLISYILIFVAGIMITISINELLPRSLEYKQDKMLKLGLLVGFLISLANHFLL